LIILIIWYILDFTIFLIKKGRPGLNGKKGAKGDSGGGYGNGYQVKKNIMYLDLIVTIEVQYTIDFKLILGTPWSTWATRSSWNSSLCGKI